MLYRNIRRRVSELLNEVKRAGYDQVHIKTITNLDDPKLASQSNDVADVCRLTCMEQGIRISQEEVYPTILVNGAKVTLRMDGLS